MLQHALQIKFLVLIPLAMAVAAVSSHSAQAFTEV